jgi:endonuclease/exonuclease/phosphatase family metal-dependent hydrolase
MRIATWNLERGGRKVAARAAQEAVLQKLGADIIVLTEPPASYQCRPGVVVSPAKRSGPKGGESWVAIVGPSVEPVALDIPFARMAVAATALVGGTPVVVYGSVLPWGFFDRAAPELVLAGETAEDAFRRLLREQAGDIAELRRRHPEHIVIWAGDFNQTISGPNYGGSNVKRDALLRALDELGLVGWNAAAANAKDGMHAIDLICGPREVTVARQGRIDPVLDDMSMSDHAGYWVEF